MIILSDSQKGFATLLMTVLAILSQVAGFQGLTVFLGFVFLAFIVEQTLFIITRDFKESKK